MTLHITTHAIERLLERVNPRLTWDEAREALSSPAIQCAARIGAPYVKLGTGQRVVIDNGSVVTVLPKDENVRCLDRRLVRKSIRENHQ